MGLRINSSQYSLNSIRDSQNRFNQSLARIATGRQILKASDNPAGLVISEQFGAQLASLQQAFDNTTYANNLFSTADAALDEVSGRLRDLRGLVTQAQNFSSPEQRSAIQRAIDANLSAIDRIGATTRFADTNLLDGSRAIQTSGASAELEEIDVYQAEFGGQDQLNFNLEITAPATQANVTAANDVNDVIVNGGEATLQIRGAEGTATITLADGATGQDLLDAVNSVSGQTGVTAINNGGAVELQSQGYGSNATVSATQVAGAGTFTPANPVDAAGTDIEGTLNGQEFTADGNTINISNASVDAQIQVAAGTGAGSYNFVAQNSGVTVQLGTQATGADNLTAGFRSIDSGSLGDPGARLASLRSGGANDAFNNPGGALAVIDRAISQVSEQRARLGSVQSNVLESNVNSLGVAIENVARSRSSIADADIAKEIAEQTRNKLLLDAAVATRRQSQNILRNSVLSLLQQQ